MFFLSEDSTQCVDVILDCITDLFEVLGVIHL